MALPATRHPERVATIRRHRLDTVAFLLASDPNCIQVTDEVVRRVTGRTLVRVRPQGMPKHPLPGSWALGALLCPGDDTAAVAEWARALAPEDRRERIWFYEAPGVEPVDAYESWIARGLDSEVLRDPFTDWKDFNRLFGNDLNERIWLDFGAS